MEARHILADNFLDLLVHGDVEVRPVERQVVVPTVPEQDVALLLGLLEDRSVVDARVHDRAGVDVGLVLLPFLDRLAVEVLERLELRLARQRVSGRTTMGSPSGH